MTVPQPVAVRVLKVDKNGTARWMPHLVLPPTGLVQNIWTHYPTLFPQIFGADPRAFWAKVDPQDPKLKRLGTMTQEPNWMDVYLPYVVHGDGARFTTKGSQSLLTVQWKPLLGLSYDCSISPASQYPSPSALQ